MARLPGDRALDVHETVIVSGAASFDPDGDRIRIFNWRLRSRPVDSIAHTGEGTDESTSFGLDVPGLYFLELIVNDALLDSQPAIMLIVAGDGMSLD